MMRTYLRRTGHVLTAVAALLAGVATADEFDLIRSTIDGGGAMNSAGEDFELSGTVGQSDAGVMMTGQDFELTGGFWFGQAPGDCNYDSAINLFDFDAFTDCMSAPRGGLIAPGCICFDIDLDTDVDLLDFGSFQAQFTVSQ